MNGGRHATTRSIRAAIGLGSNLDDPRRQVLDAMRALDELPHTRLLRQSRLYSSPPWGLAEQPWFVNAAATVETELPAPVLHAALKGLEDAVGRRRDGPRWGPRILDLDLLLYGDLVIDTPSLTVPHPRMGGRAFVLVPLAEIAGDWPLPGGGTVAEACAALDPAALRLDCIAPAG
ncbi:MAG TPA: 2-amino-4-hydroxy-6-hydroxymethyldihydropteridine diphosphokinase [Xanthomonadaceae bacterium]|nr:2-amino-4-hydroxy-6-hydroxymethyldihydropteridine diphosphokinase [Xanthomonadaceae bacterium]